MHSLVFLSLPWLVLQHRVELVELKILSYFISLVLLLSVLISPVGECFVQDDTV